MLFTQHLPLQFGLASTIVLVSFLPQLHSQTIDYGMVAAEVQGTNGIALAPNTGGFMLFGLTPGSGFNPTNATLAGILNPTNMISISNSFSTIDASNPGLFYVSAIPTLFSSGATLAAGTQLYALASMSSSFDVSAPWALVTGIQTSWLSPSPTDPFGLTIIELSFVGNSIIAANNGGAGVGCYFGSTPGTTVSPGDAALVFSSALQFGVAAGFTNTYAQPIVGGYSVAKSGAGMQILSASNNFTGPLSVQFGTMTLASPTGGAAASVGSVAVATGAFLLIAEDNQVNNGAAVSLSGGTIRRGAGVSETFGNLNLTASSFIDFGNVHEVELFQFGTFSPGAYTLTLQNFRTGNSLSFSTAQPIGMSSFGFSNSDGYTTNFSNNTFTITAVPESSTAVAALALSAVLGFTALRRRPTLPRQVGSS